MQLLVRSWNLFHGNTDPPGRRGYLRAMVELATQDDPDVLCLQEVPVWALERLDDWSGMRVLRVVTRRPLRPGPVSAWMTRAHQGFFRSGVAGQANAILVAPRHPAEDLGHVRISAPRREPRFVHAGRIGGVVVGNLHATNSFSVPSVPREETRRAAAFVESRARSGETVVLAGDFNVADPGLEGYTSPGDGIDHVLVRGSAATLLSVWPRERRTCNGLVLSDHAPVELLVGHA